MSKAKGKGGTGRGTDKKGWNRWQASANKKKSAKPYISKGIKKRIMKMTLQAIVKVNYQ
ncbi:DUF3934 domain-containing protein [Bacillus xiapuensis]|uniref:DUF3934 domain-containing protein n=1 Tax=Bacillus xiapuensis TaxID=2014075 RepID=A0ABU6NGL6_9BACI|nr:DUF3934 domain-containing protein [Bacillus xiapuensis]